MKIHQFSAEEALASLKSRHDGLSQAEVQHRLKRVWSESGRSNAG